MLNNISLSGCMRIRDTGNIRFSFPFHQEICLQKLKNRLAILIFTTTKVLELSLLLHSRHFHSTMMLTPTAQCAGRLESFPHFCQQNVSRKKFIIWNFQKQLKSALAKWFQLVFHQINCLTLRGPYFLCQSLLTGLYLIQRGSSLSGPGNGEGPKDHSFP